MVRSTLLMRNVQLSDNKPTSSYALQKVHRKDRDYSTSVGDDELDEILRLRYATLENDSTY